MRSVSTFAQWIASVFLLLALDGAARAATAGGDLYEAETIVTGEREETRIPGFAECLEQVLVKVSGDPRLIGDKRVAVLAGEARTFVSDFRYHDRMSGIPHHDEQGTRDRPYDLIVAFDRAKIDAALRSLGREPWTAVRPRIAVFLGMRNLTSAFMVAGDGDRELERSALAAAAKQLGIAATLPSRAALADSGLRFENLPAADPARLGATASGGELALVGRMVWSDQALAWIADWRLGAEGRTYQWQAKSVTFDDGFRQAMGGVAQILSGRGSPSEAQETSALYQAVVIVTGSDMRSRPSGFAEALREILVKVSGAPLLLRGPRVAELAAHADTFVLSFDYVDQLAGVPRHDDQGTYDRPHDLTVRFDPARIDTALAELGERPWRGARPTIVPVVAVHGFGKSYLLSAETPAGVDQRAAFANVAGEYGMNFRIPAEAELAAWSVTADRFPSPQTAPAADQALVAGTLEFDEALPGWVGSWRMRWRDADYAWRISGVNFDEAFRDIVRGVVRVASGHGAP
jgi:hypothetical protein